MNKRRAFALAVSVALTASLGLAGCSSAGSQDSGKPGSAEGAQDTLVVDKSFDIKSADPARQYEPTSSMVTRAIYQSLVTFPDDDVTKVVPQLASYEMSEDLTTMTLTMEEGHTFSDGTPVTVDDAVFSLQRVQGIKGNPSFLLADLSIAKTSDNTMTITAQGPRPDLPAVIANQSLAVMNKKLLEENGGTADADDGAEQFLATTSAGSGPYVLESYDVTSRITLKASDNYKGEAPAFKKVVFRNVAGATQQMNVQSGETQIALDLSPVQAAQLDQQKVKLNQEPSPTVIFVFLNQDPAVSTVTSNAEFVKAVRLGVDYERLIELAGKGARQADGVIPSIMAGGLDVDPGITRDVEAAKSALASSGYSGQKVTLAYANDLTVQGIELQTFASAIQEQLKEVGIAITLAPAPVATELDAYRGGKEEMGLWYWEPDYMHPSVYLAFAPGKTVGLRAGWASDDEVTATVDKAQVSSGDDLVSAYTAYQVALNEKGPFIPLVQPEKSIAYAKNLTELGLNPAWTIDVSKVK
ncbi:MAG: ABC transporter substrate-binding protein [Actinomycetaceae bacterium]|nr:ABC transporter substrate-binding protein [Actinomycetaceae bacterium]